MVRKLEQFLADDARRDDDNRLLISRTEERREKQRVETALLGFAKQLSELKPKQLQQLELDEHVLSILDELRVIDSPPARMRAMKRLRAELRDVDLDAFGRKLADILDPPQRKSLDPVATWCENLRSGGDTALNAFLEQFPAADRAQLRTLVRNLKGAAPTASQRALSKLSVELRAAMQKKRNVPSAAAADGDAQDADAEVVPQRELETEA
jgi:ribosome-associated protein